MGENYKKMKWIGEDVIEDGVEMKKREERIIG